ncbi:MAG TPA: di-heme oxidoredictase family protein, partial [Verrucomicrobiae bacterium]|nr:di-heme oxidoredictase family protein [Verrucomicrobiae bacterium]
GMQAARAQARLSIETGTQLSWPAATNRSYQLQWSPGFGGDWSNLGNLLPGQDSAISLYDPAGTRPRQYRVLEMVPVETPVSSVLTNGGFETGADGLADGWIVDTATGGPVQAVRTNTNPHSGSFHFEVRLASTGAGPVVQFHHVFPIPGGTNFPLTFSCDAVAGSSGYNAQWRILWSDGSDTGYQTFTPGADAYAVISNSVVVPPTATSGTLYFHFAGAANPSQSASIDLDDVSLAGSNSGVNSAAVTNVLSAAALPAARVTWPTAAGIQYQPETTTNIAAGNWQPSFPMMIGDGGAGSVLLLLTNQSLFVRVSTPPVAVLPPSDVTQLPSGKTNAVRVAWTPSSTPGVLGYRILYGLAAASLTNSVEVANVNSVTLLNLDAGETYYLSVLTIAAAGESSPSPAVTAIPDTTADVIPLFDPSTALEPDTISNTPSALITWIADRPRLRHARESEFMLYDTYHPFYWEQRMTVIQIIDTIGKGGSTLTFNFSTLNALDQPNVRFFFQGQTTVAQYSDNLFAEQVDSSLTNWTSTITQNTTFNRPLQAGDRVELEFSPFMLTVTNGQLNYYGGAILYVAGQGIVPWQEGATDDPGAVNAALDSVPMPTNGWLAGINTMPYQYSGEPNHVFNQLSPGASPPTGQAFLLGRRLHETDFSDGAHAEPGNPVYTEQIGKLGPRFNNVSCVSCHANNGRALPPAIGVPLTQALIRVAADANGAPDPILGSVLQTQNTTGAAEDSVVISGYTTINGTYGDGAPYTLRKPNYSFSPYTPTFYSVRLAPALVGMGLLEAVGEDTVHALADADASGGDGIRGHFQTVIDPQTAQLRMGRFGYKAGKARVSDQIASALNTDMGVTTAAYPELDGETNSGPVELSNADLANWTRYVSCLGVNARRNLADPQCLHGEQLFLSANCARCHTPTLKTSPYAPMAELRSQTIHPYTDLLLHDLGPGLADNLGEGNATGSEWRTAPLWSIGLTAGVSGGEAYLHDGRARTLEEAILWHDGEAASSREAFRNMPAVDRAALIAFLKSL